MLYRKRTRQAYIALLVALVILVSALPAAAQLVRVETGTLNVRSGPGTSYSVITQVQQGTVLAAHGQEGSWTRVSLPGSGRGWVSTQFTAPHAPSGYALVTASALNVRSGPSTGHAVIDQLPEGTAAAAIGSRDGWLQVVIPSGRQGWLAGWFTSSLPFQGYASVTATFLNLRGGPGTNHAVLDRLPAGAVLAITGRQDGWLQVVTDRGTTGWVSGSFTASLPETNRTPPPSRSGSGSPVSGKTIVLDPGHGGPDPGAVGVTGLLEKVINFQVSMELVTLLQNAGAKVLMTRYSDWNPTLWQRVNLANTSGAHVFVSVHANAHPGSWATGTETYYCSWTSHSRHSRQLAASLQRRLAAALGLRDLGVKTAGFYVIANSHMPSALVELGFLSNRGDEALLKRPETPPRAAHALFLGLEDYFR